MAWMLMDGVDAHGWRRCSWMAWMLMVVWMLRVVWMLKFLRMLTIVWMPMDDVDAPSCVDAHGQGFVSQACAGMHSLCACPSRGNMRVCVRVCRCA